MATYFTITHCDTGDTLGGRSLDRQKALSILTTRKTDNSGRRFAKSEWSVTEWGGDGSDDDEIVAQIGAEEFVELKGRIPA